MSRKNQSKKRSAAALLEALKQETPEPRELEKEFKNSSTQTEQLAPAAEVSNTDMKLNKMLLLLAHANAKLDAIGSAGPSKCEHDCATVTLRKISLNPVKSLTELVALEENCKREEFVKAAVASIGQLHGRQRYTSRGATVCLQVVDYFFDREFLVHCSWTGTGRKLGENQQVPRKIPFQRYEKVIDLFYQTILHSDPEFTFDECKNFLHRCLRNAKQRLEELGGTRKPVARNRKQLRELNQQDEEYLDDTEQENQEETEGTETVWTMEVAAADVN
nr:uncharacterized protein LOC115258147 [Aedes albopictus]